MKGWIQAWLLLSACLPLAATAKPCGGDGPIPFINMTGNITLPVKSIQSVGGLQEFTYWESQNALVYRNNSDELRVSYFGSGLDSVLTHFPFPLSKVVDPAEKYLTSDDANWFYDASTSGPLIRYSKKMPAEKLFWKDKDLYLMKWVTPLLFDPPHFEIGTYTAGEASAKLTCRYYPPPGMKLNFVEGHTYPDAFLYQKIPFNGKNRVAFYRLNVTTCSATPMGLPTEPIEGTILEVHRFDRQDAFAIRVDHPTKNFRWEMAGRCEYLTVGQDVVMIPNHERPLAVSWSPAKGLTFFNLETKVKADAFRGIGISNLSSRDLWIPRHDSDLLLSPELTQPQERRMMTVDVEQILPVANH